MGERRVYEVTVTFVTVAEAESQDGAAAVVRKHLHEMMDELDDASIDALPINRDYYWCHNWMPWGGDGVRTVKQIEDAIAERQKKETGR